MNARLKGNVCKISTCKYEKVDARKVHIKFQLIRLFYLFIWWCETTEGFIDSHFDVKVSNVFFRCYGGLIIFILLGCALPLISDRIIVVIVL